MVSRFVIHYDARGEREHPKGDFVHWSDYQALLERAEAAERALAEAKKALEEIENIRFPGWGAQTAVDILRLIAHHALTGGRNG